MEDQARARPRIFLAAAFYLITAFAVAQTDSKTVLTVLHVPDDSWETWALTPGCGDALQVYEVRNDEKAVARLMPEESVAYRDGESFVLISRSPGCAKVRLSSGESGFVASPLAYPTEQERQAAAAAIANEKIRRQQAARAAANRKSAREKAAREEQKVVRDELDWIAKQPVLDDGAAKIFMAEDEKCSQEFVQAVRTPGVEGRKKVADLLLYHCGDLEDTGTHVSRIRSDGDYCNVSIVTGPNVGHSGWVPCAWVK